MGKFGDWVKRAATTSPNNKSYNSNYGNHSNDNYNSISIQTEYVDPVFNVKESVDTVYKTDKITSTKSKEYNSSNFNNSDNATDSFTLPHWGIKDFINERVAWQKSTTSLTGGPGYSYFKIFFDFSTAYGLLGGLVPNDTGQYEYGENTALQYLQHIINRNNNYSTELSDRQTALYRFANTLNFIATKSPWFFKSVSNADNATSIDFSKLTEEKTLDITCMPDAIDMRLTTLFDLYKFACFDVVKQKEVIPENLRKFDMQIVMFETPIRNWQTAIKSFNGKKAGYKSLYDNDMTNRISFKMVTFKNCEFVLNSLKTLPNAMSNESPFQREYSFQIKYDRAYEHNLNEWMQIFFGANQILWDKEEHPQENITSPAISERIKAMEYALDHIYYYNPKSSNYKSLVDASEDVIMNAMRCIDNDSWVGNATNWLSDKVNEGLDKTNDSYKSFLSNAGFKVYYSQGLNSLVHGSTNTDFSKVHQVQLGKGIQDITGKRYESGYTDQNGNPIYYTTGNNNEEYVTTPTLEHNAILGEGIQDILTPGIKESVSEDTETKLNIKKPIVNPRINHEPIIGEGLQKLSNKGSLTIKDNKLTLK